MLVVAAIALTLALLALFARRELARRGSGRLAQVRFRKLHGARVATLLAGEVDPRPHSPWIAIQVDGRPARMVAAPLGGRMQAGIELFGWSIPVNVWHTGGAEDEVEVPPHVDRTATLALTTRLAAADVDSLAAAVPIAHAADMPHVLRMRFDSVDELPNRLDEVAALLHELEALAPASR